MSLALGISCDDRALHSCDVFEYCTLFQAFDLLFDHLIFRPHVVLNIK